MFVLQLFATTTTSSTYWKLKLQQVFTWRWISVCLPLCIALTILFCCPVLFVLVMHFHFMPSCFTVFAGASEFGLHGTFFCTLLCVLHKLWQRASDTVESRDLRRKLVGLKIVFVSTSERPLLSDQFPRGQADYKQACNFILCCIYLS